MKKLYLTSLLPLLAALPASGETPWWQQNTVCRLDPTTCYTGMGTGYDKGLWDADSKCRGMKIICGDALEPASDTNTTVSRNDIRAGDGINSDFDITLLNGDCFGRRKTQSGGTQASVDGKYVNVWCSGVLNNINTREEITSVTNGEIIAGTQPKCSDLAESGYIGVLNNNCYGKQYDLDDYYIDCSGNSLLPKQIIVLNGANYDENATVAPMDMNTAKAKFETMYSVSQAQRENKK